MLPETVKAHREQKDLTLAEDPEGRRHRFISAYATALGARKDTDKNESFGS